MNQYIDRGSVGRRAEIVAEFLHPVTDAPMVTYYQTSDLRGEEPEFFTISKKEFHGYYRPTEGEGRP